MKKAILFDLDGVLIKSLDSNGKYLWSKHLKKDLGLTKEHCARIFGPQWRDVTTGAVGTREHLNTVFEDPIFKDLSVSADTFIDYWLSQESHEHVNKDMLKMIQNLPMPKYIATNQESYRTPHIQSLLPACFEKTFASFEIGYIKPEEGFYKHIQTELGLYAHEIVLIDDTFENVQKAQELGWQTYWYKNDLKTLKIFLEAHS